MNWQLLVILAILVLCFEIYRLLRCGWNRQILKKKKGAKQARKPRVMKAQKRTGLSVLRAGKDEKETYPTKNTGGMDRNKLSSNFGPNSQRYDWWLIL